jgi:hypothetical protein
VGIGFGPVPIVAGGAGIEGAAPPAADGCGLEGAAGVVGVAVGDDAAALPARPDAGELGFIATAALPAVETGLPLESASPPDPSSEHAAISSTAQAILIRSRYIACLAFVVARAPVT